MGYTMFLTGPSMDRVKRREHILGAFRNEGVVIRAENSIVEAALHLAVPRRCHQAYRNWYPVWIGGGYPLGARLSAQMIATTGRASNPLSSRRVRT